MKPRTMTRAFAACAIAMLASGCADGGGGPTVRPPSPFGTDPAPATGSEPTIGGNDSLPGQETSLEELCSVACAHLVSACPVGAGADCQASCVGAGEAFPTCIVEFRAYVACIATAPVFCNGSTLEITACDRTELPLARCTNSLGR